MWRSRWFRSSLADSVALGYYSWMRSVGKNNKPGPGGSTWTRVACSKTYTVETARRIYCLIAEVRRKHRCAANRYGLGRYCAISRTPSRISYHPAKQRRSRCRRRNHQPYDQSIVPPQVQCWNRIRKCVQRTAVSESADCRSGTPRRPYYLANSRSTRRWYIRFDRRSLLNSGQSLRLESMGTCRSRPTAIVRPTSVRLVARDGECVVGMFRQLGKS